MLRKNALALVLGLVIGASWLVEPWSWLRSETPVPSPALSIRSGQPTLTAREAGHRRHQTQPHHWRALVLRGNSAMRR